MPEGKVAVAKQLPHAVFLEILVLVHAALPPLHVAARVHLVDALVRAGAHEGAHAHPRVRARLVDVDNVLQHGMVQQKAVHGPVAALDKHLLEPALVQSLDAGLASVAAPQELDVRIGVVGKHVDHFIVEALVEVVAVFEVHFADLGLVCSNIRQRTLGILIDSTRVTRQTYLIPVRAPFAAPPPAS